MTYRTLSTPKSPSWWVRHRCQFGFHLWQVKTVLVKVEDGEVDMPDGFYCLYCDKKRVGEGHRIRDYKVCDCETCCEARKIEDPALKVYQHLRVYGPILGPAKLVAIHIETIENHPLYKEHGQ